MFVYVYLYTCITGGDQAEKINTCGDSFCSQFATKFVVLSEHYVYTHTNTYIHIHIYDRRG